MKLSDAIPFSGTAKVVVTLVLIALLAWGGWTIAYRLFIQPMDLKKAEGDKAVAEEQAKAESVIADKTVEKIKERDVYRETVTNIVRESEEQVDASWNGETVGADVDAAGAAALCGLHNSLCRVAPAEGVQPVR